MANSVRNRLEDIANRLIDPVLRAGAIEMQHYEAGFEVERKSDESPVTVADRDAEAILLAALADIAPDIPVVAEEAVSEGCIPVIGHSFFLVDPLDGTKEFINKRGEFTVNVALIEDGAPVLGIVYAPAIGDLYATLEPGKASLAHVAPGRVARVRSECDFQPIHVRQPGPRLTAVASRSHKSAETEEFLARFAIGERRDSGSSLKFCAIARGEADIYPRLAPTMEWDIAAGHAILVAAGGAVTTPEGQAIRYGKAESGFRNGHFVAWGSPQPIPARS